MDHQFMRVLEVVLFAALGLLIHAVVAFIAYVWGFWLGLIAGISMGCLWVLALVRWDEKWGSLPAPRIEMFLTRLDGSTEWVSFRLDFILDQIKPFNPGSPQDDLVEAPHCEGVKGVWRVE